MDRKREVQRILLEHIKVNGIAFKYMITCDYFYKQKDYNKVLSDNKHLRRVLRKFYKDDIRMLFFIEKHTHKDSPHYLGYHRHILVEDVIPERWLDPTGGMMSLMMKLDISSAFGMKMKTSAPSEDIQRKLLGKVLRDLNQAIPNGYKGSDVTPLTECRGGVTGAIEYLTKQVDIYHPANEVIDVSNSRMNPLPLLNLYESNKNLCGLGALIPV